MSAEYRIEYQIQRRREDAAEDDFVEIGFGSSGGWRDLETCTHMLGAAVQNGEWETEPGQPSPADVLGGAA